MSKNDTENTFFSRIGKSHHTENIFKVNIWPTLNLFRAVLHSQGLGALRGFQWEPPLRSGRV